MPDKLFDIRDIVTKSPEQVEAPKRTHRRTTQCYDLSTKYLYRRAFSEISLLDACGAFEFQEGHAYHFITGGDVDSLSYLKAILHQQPLTYCLFSTWCMAAEDILQFEEWLQAGRIEHLDAYVGEIFPIPTESNTGFSKTYSPEIEGRENCGVQKPFENIRRCRAEVRLRRRNLGEHQYQSANRKRLHYHRPRHLRILSGIFRRNQIL